MSGLTDFIGVKGHHASPASGRFINELAGISLKSMQKVANEEQLNFLGVWNDVQSRAWMRLTTDLRNKLRAKYLVKSNRGLFYVVSTATGNNVAASNHYRGWVIDTGLDENGFFAFYVNQISVDLPEAVPTLIVKLFDRAGAVLDTFTVSDAVAGINTVTVAKSYSTAHLFVAVDCTSVALKQTEFEPSCLNSCCDMICDLLGNGCEPSVYGAEAMKVTPARQGKTSTSYGITADVMATCDYSSIIGYQKDTFTAAWMYLLGHELMLERMYSDRKNMFTTVDAETAVQLKDHYLGEYENALNDAVAGIRINTNDACIECRQMVAHREALP